VENNNTTASCKECKVFDVLADIQKNFSRMEDDTKAGFAKFERKQEQILEVLGDYKVLLNEIKNLRNDQQRLEEQFVREHTNAREESIAIFQRLNELEKSKADKAEMKESKGWLWGLLIMGLSVLANFVFDLLRGHISPGK
jgi:hypothetical protein